MDEVLVVELHSVDGFTSGTIAASKITSLDHEALDHAVESAALVVEGLATAALSLLSGAKSSNHHA